MTRNAEILRVIVGEYIGPVLKTAGFKRVAGRFARKVDGLLHLIEVQRSAAKTNGVRFRLNYGVICVRVAQFFGAAADELWSYDVESCHWIERAGPHSDPHSGPRGDPYSERWWEVSSHGEVPVIASDVVRVLDTVVLPALDEITNEDQLRQLWLGGSGRGITEAQRLAYLSVLLLNPEYRRALGPVIARLEELAKRSAVREFARSHLKRLSPHLTSSTDE